MISYALPPVEMQNCIHLLTSEPANKCGPNQQRCR